MTYTTQSNDIRPYNIISYLLPMSRHYDSGNNPRHALVSRMFALALTFFLLPSQPLHAAASEASLSQQRTLFQTAHDALKNGRQEQYNRLSQQLLDYPLYPYLEYWQITQDITKSDHSAINSFISKYNETPLASRLRNRWLEQLLKQEQWSQFIAFYAPDDDVGLQCNYRYALYKTDNKQAALKGLDELWLTADALPHDCDLLISVWRDAGLLDQALTWKRLTLLMQGGKIYEARALEPYLSSEQQRWAALWHEVHLHPETMLINQQLKENSPINRTILAHGMQRLTRLNPQMAAETWRKLTVDYTFNKDDYDRVETNIALTLARTKAPNAMRWLTSLSNADNAAVREWRVITAINLGKWSDALTWINQLTAAEQDNERWQYWRGRAYEATGNPEQALQSFIAAAKNRDYYGFMAADRIGVAYEFENRTLQFSKEEMEATRKLPTIQRTREFYALNDVSNARREWHYLTLQASTTTLLKAARVAHEWGWHDRAITALIRAKYMDEMDIRFPLAYREQIMENANLQKIDPSWAYAIIRQESAFASDARSPKGAMGLMQIMPDTGKMIAKELSMNLSNGNQLLDTDTNIRFGISYLRKALNRFDQNTVLATAAYNAGSQRVKSWLPDEKVTTDLWIENIPYKETRNYVKQVLSFATIYDDRLKRSATPFKMRMPQIEIKTTPSR